MLAVSYLANNISGDSSLDAISVDSAMSVIEMETGSVGESAVAMEEPDVVTKTTESKKYKTQQKNRISNNILFF